MSAHLQTRALLNADQIAHYEKLRGYGDQKARHSLTTMVSSVTPRFWWLKPPRSAIGRTTPIFQKPRPLARKWRSAGCHRDPEGQQQRYRSWQNIGQAKRKSRNFRRSQPFL